MVSHLELCGVVSHLVLRGAVVSHLILCGAVAFHLVLCGIVALPSIMCGACDTQFMLFGVLLPPMLHGAVALSLFSVDHGTHLYVEWRI